MTTTTLYPTDTPPVTTPGSTLRHQILRGRDSIRAVYPEWQRLVDYLEAPQWSTLPAAFETWITQMRNPDATPLVTVRDGGGRLRGVFPLMRDRVMRGPSMAPRFDYDPADGYLLGRPARRIFPLRQISCAASLPATMAWGAPLCRNEELAEVIDVVAAAIVSESAWDVIVLTAVVPDETDLWAAAFGKLGYRARIQSLDRVVQNISMMEPFETIMARQKGKFRQNVRRARKFAEEAGVRFRIVVGAEAVRAEFPTIHNIASHSWKAVGRDQNPLNIPYDARQQSYMEGFFSSPLLHGNPVLAIAEGPDGPTVVLLLLEAGGTVTALLTFWNGALERASPGLLLLGQAIDWAVQRGARRFDLNATAPWVRYIANEFTPLVNVVVFSRRPWGRLAKTIAVGSGRLK